jgi:PhzF family phenazine biosynthesis protein
MALRLPVYQLNAFSSVAFGGNPAAVCLVEDWPEDDLMASIAREQGVPTTAFVRMASEPFEVRYFAPIGEFALVGHASLAIAQVLLGTLFPDRPSMELRRSAGTLHIGRGSSGCMTITLPSVPPVPCRMEKQLSAAIGVPVAETWSSSGHYFALCEDEQMVRSLQPDMSALMLLDRDAVVATARGEDCQFVSRAFAPKEGLDEDPVCGSAHLTLVPYWSERLGRRNHRALQLSKRGGELFCSLDGEAVELAGRCALYLEGTICV